MPAFMFLDNEEFLSQSNVCHVAIDRFYKHSKDNDKVILQGSMRDLVGNYHDEAVCVRGAWHDEYRCWHICIHLRHQPKRTMLLEGIVSVRH